MYMPSVWCITVAEHVIHGHQQLTSRLNHIIHLVNHALANSVISVGTIAITDVPLFWMSIYVCIIILSFVASISYQLNI